MIKIGDSVSLNINFAEYREKTNNVHKFKAEVSVKRGNSFKRLSFSLYLNDNLSKEYSKRQLNSRVFTVIAIKKIDYKGRFVKNIESPLNKNKIIHSHKIYVDLEDDEMNIISVPAFAVNYEIAPF